MGAVVWGAIAWALLSVFLLADVVYYMKTGHHFW